MMKIITSKMRASIKILTIGIVLSGGWWVAHGQICTDTEEVIIATDKIEYKQGETVKITIRNNLDVPLRNYDMATKGVSFPNQYVGWGFIERFENGNWIKIEPLWRCGDTCFAKCKLSVNFFVLGPKETTIFPEDFRRFEWNQTRLLCSNGKTIGSEPVGSGRYRISSTFWDESKEIDTKRTFYSNEFIIKKKTVKNLIKT